LGSDSFQAPYDGFIEFVCLSSIINAPDAVGQYTARAELSLRDYITTGIGTPTYRVPGVILHHQRTFRTQTGGISDTELIPLATVIRYPIAAGQRVYLLCTIQAGAVINADATVTFFPKLGHVSRLTRPPNLKIARPGTSKELNQKVVTLFGAREAALDGLGQLLYAGELILKNYDLWSGDPDFKSIPGRGIFPTAPPEMEAVQLLELMDGYFGQGVEYLKKQLTTFGRIRPHEALWKELAVDPISMVVGELLDRALSQSKPRQWITAHFRSRSVLGLAERPE
jgi:hypothetical protein